MSFKNRRFSSKKNSRHNYCKCLVFLQRMLIFISKIMDILIQIQKKICWEPIFRFFLRGQHSTNFKKKYKSTHFNFTVYSTRMTEEELWLHNALLDVQFCGNEKEVGIIYLLIQGYHVALDDCDWQWLHIAKIWINVKTILSSSCNENALFLNVWVLAIKFNKYILCSYLKNVL